MRILYDGQTYSQQAAGGINRYFANIINRLPAEFAPCLTTPQRPTVNYPSHPNLRVLRYHRFRPQRVSFRMEQPYFRLATAARRFDLAHPTYYTLLTGREVSAYRCPAVVTVWDMIHELFPGQVSGGEAAVEAKRRAVEAADALLCISEKTRADLLERYPHLEARVTVTHLASEIDENLARGDEPVPARPYYLYVGSRAAYKNFDRLLEAFARVAPARRDLALCVVGPALDDAERKRIAELKLADRVEWFGHPGDRQLARLYRESVALAYPSLYEGFGIPPVEAMACGGAVIAARAASIPEVVGDAGLLFDPYSTDDLADALALLFDDASERERLVARGRVRAKLFSWDRTAARTVEVYRAVAGR